MDLKTELIDFLEANNWFSLEDRKNAEGVVDAYIKAYKEQLPLTDVVGQSEQLKPMLFELANKLAIAGEGDAAVGMHRIHNRL